jgi:competence protein ComGC
MSDNIIEKLIDEQFKKIIEEQKVTFIDATKSCSDICRYITFALLTVIWGLYCKVDSSSYDFLYLLLGLLIIYLIVDILQYLVLSIRHRTELLKLQNKEVKIKVPEDTKDDELVEAIYSELGKPASKINEKAFNFFIAKIIILLIVSLLIILFIINLGSEIQICKIDKLPHL